MLAIPVSFNGHVAGAAFGCSHTLIVKGVVYEVGVYADGSTRAPFFFAQCFMPCTFLWWQPILICLKIFFLHGREGL